jgi:hypothetical protein
MPQPPRVADIPPMDERDQEAAEDEEYVGAGSAELEQQSERRGAEIRRGAKRVAAMAGQNHRGRHAAAGFDALKAKGR